MSFRPWRNIRELEAQSRKPEGAGSWKLEAGRRKVKGAGSSKLEAGSRKVKGAGSWKLEAGRSRKMWKEFEIRRYELEACLFG